MSPDELERQRRPVPLRPGGGAVGALLAARDELENLATQPGSLGRLAAARSRRDELLRLALDVGFDVKQVARFAGVTDEYASRFTD